MPPQSINISPELEGDAATRGLDLSVVLSLLKRYWRECQQRRRGQRVTLHDLSGRQLMDIGLTRAEIDYFTPGRALDRLRDRAMDPWARGAI